MTSRFLNNSLAGLAGMALHKVAGIATSVALARMLGAEQFGVYAFVGTLVFLLGFLTDLGMERVLTRELAAKQSEAAALLSNALALKVVLGLSVAGLGAVLGKLLALDSVSYRCLLLALGALPLGFDLLARAYFQSRLEVAAYYRISLVGSVSFLALVGLCWWWEASVVGVFVAGLANALGVGALFLVSLRARVRFGWSLVPARVRMLLAEGFQVGLLGLLFTIALRIDQVILYHLRGAEEVGQYAAAVRLTEALGILPEAVMLSLFPLLAAAHTSDPQRFRRRYRLGFRYLAAAAVPLALICTFAGAELLELVFGAKYRTAAPAVAWLSWNMLLSFLGAVYLNVYLIQSLYRLLIGVSTVCTLLNIGLNFLWIPTYGLSGAAAATVVSTLVGFGLWFVFPFTRGAVADCVREGTRAFVAGAAGGLAALAWPTTSGAVCAAVATGVYLTTLPLLGGLRWADVRRVTAR